MDIVYTFFTVYGVCRLINDLCDLYILSFKKNEKVNEKVNEVINETDSLDSFSLSSGSSDEVNIFPVKRKRI